MTDSPEKLVLEKINGTLIILLYVSLSSTWLQTFLSLIKNTKRNHSSASDWWENTKPSFKEDARTFSEKFKKILEYHTGWALENKQAKSTKLCANIRWWELKGKKYSKTFFKILDGQNMQNQTIFELYKLMI